MQSFLQGPQQQPFPHHQNPATHKPVASSPHCQNPSRYKCNTSSWTANLAFRAWHTNCLYYNGQVTKKSTCSPVKHCPLRFFSHSCFCSTLCALTDLQFCGNTKFTLTCLHTFDKQEEASSFCPGTLKVSPQIPNASLLLGHNHLPEVFVIRDGHCSTPVLADFLCMRKLLSIIQGTVLNRLTEDGAKGTHFC